MPKLYRLSIFLALIIAIAAISFFSVKKVVVSAQGRVALTATEQKTTYDRTTGNARVRTVVHAIRGDGSAVEAWSVAKPGNNTGTAMKRRIIDLASAEEVAIDGLTESTTTTPIPTQTLNYYRMQPKCTTSASPMRATLLGYEVVRIIDERKTSTRLIRREEWRAPALDCLVLKKMVSFGKTEADLSISNINEVVEIKVGEPSPTFFTKPTGYTERSPSQVSAEHARRYPEDVCPACTRTDQEMDALYYHRRAQRN